MDPDPSNPTHNLQQSRLEMCIHKSSVCLGALFPLPIIATALESTRFYNLVLAHCMLGAAMVLLHHPLAERQLSSMSKCQTWARKVLHTAQLVNEMEYSKLSPVIAVCILHLSKSVIFTYLLVRSVGLLRLMYSCKN
jgi:hypothetical protein